MVCPGVKHSSRLLPGPYRSKLIAVISVTIALPEGTEDQALQYTMGLTDAVSCT
jgi:hypothetical protein